MGAIGLLVSPRRQEQRGSGRVLGPGRASVSRGPTSSSGALSGLGSALPASNQRTRPGWPFVLGPPARWGWVRLTLRPHEAGQGPRLCACGPAPSTAFLGPSFKPPPPTPPGAQSPRFFFFLPLRPTRSLLLDGPASSRPACRVGGGEEREPRLIASSALVFAHAASGSLPSAFFFFAGFRRQAALAATTRFTRPLTRQHCQPLPCAEMTRRHCTAKFLGEDVCILLARAGQRGAEREALSQPPPPSSAVCRSFPPLFFCSLFTRPVFFPRPPHPTPTTCSPATSLKGFSVGRRRNTAVFFPSFPPLLLPATFFMVRAFFRHWPSISIHVSSPRLTRFCFDCVRLSPVYERVHLMGMRERCAAAFEATGVRRESTGAGQPPLSSFNPPTRRSPATPATTGHPTTSVLRHTRRGKNQAEEREEASFLFRGRGSCLGKERLALRPRPPSLHSTHHSPPRHRARHTLYHQVRSSHP